LPDGTVVVHDVLADEVVGYQPTTRVLDQAGEVGLSLDFTTDGVSVHRLPGWAAYPIRHGPVRLFTLTPGQVGRYRANFRFTAYACATQWYYEQWTIHVANAEARSDLFLVTAPVHDVDDRVHLYGGTARRRTSADRSRS
jgi:hypothetical protein